MRILFLTLLILSSIYTKAQSDTLKANSIFIELAGAAGYYSINYDRTFHLQNNSGIIAGIGFAPSLIGGNSSPRLPIQLKLFRKIKKHTWDAGLAFTQYLSDNPDIKFKEKLKDLELGIFGQLGYKRSILKNRYYWGIALTPLLFENGDWSVYPWGALRFGYKF